MLTGKFRYRQQKRFLRSSLLVLQVEYRDTDWDGFEVIHIRRWRDATVEDVFEPIIRDALRNLKETADA